MIVPLFFLTNIKYGGFTTYTAHLCLALRQAGMTPVLHKISKRTEKKQRHFSHGIGYRNVSLDEAMGICSAVGKCVITCGYWRTHGRELEALLGLGSSIVIHDPTELDKNLVECCVKNKSRVIAIRKNNADLFQEKGLDAKFVPHPYVRTNLGKSEKTTHAISISRIDFDKHTDLILEANKILPENKQVHIYGAVNRLYTFHKLEKAYPEWEATWKGRFPQTREGPIELAASAKFVVDMSAIAGDGDGTQYTFLEAWDAGAQLVLNSAWIARSNGPVRDGVNVHTAASGDELAEILSGKPNRKLLKAGESLLSAHSAAEIAPRFIETIKGRHHA